MEKSAESAKRNSTRHDKDVLKEGDKSVRGTRQKGGKMKDSRERRKRRSKDAAVKEMESLSRDAGTFDLSLSIPLRAMTKRAAAAMEDEALTSRIGKEETEAFRSRYRELLVKLVTERSRLREVLCEISRLFDEVAEKARGEDREEKDA